MLKDYCLQIKHDIQADFWRTLIAEQKFVQLFAYSGADRLGGEWKNVWSGVRAARSAQTPPHRSMDFEPWLAL